MAGWWTAAAEAQVAGVQVKASTFVTIGVAGGDPIGLWTGVVPFTHDGVTYLGAGRVGQMSMLAMLFNGQASRVDLTMPATDPTALQRLQDEYESVRGQELTFAIGVFDDANILLAPPYTMWVGVIDVVSGSLAGPDQRGDPTIGTVGASAASIFASRKRRVLSRYSDRQQRRRSPGDRACERTNLYLYSVKHFPDY